MEKRTPDMKRHSHFIFSFVPFGSHVALFLCFRNDGTNQPFGALHTERGAATCALEERVGQPRVGKSGVSYRGGAVRCRERYMWGRGIRSVQVSIVRGSVQVPRHVFVCLFVCLRTHADNQDSIPSGFSQCEYFRLRSIFLTVV